MDGMGHRNPKPTYKKLVLKKIFEKLPELLPKIMVFVGGILNKQSEIWNAWFILFHII